MGIYKIDYDNISVVSKFMASIKPDWWDEEGAKKQLSGGIGWYYGIGEDKPNGWILCKAYNCYKTAEIESLGYNNCGIFQIGKGLQPIIEKSEEWAIEQGFVNMRFTIGSKGLSCHGKELRQPWKELKELYAIDCEEYNWFLSMGYIPSGVLPNIYGEKYHGILLVKNL